MIILFYIKESKDDTTEHLCTARGMPPSAGDTVSFNSRRGPVLYTVTEKVWVLTHHDYAGQPIQIPDEVNYECRVYLKKATED